MHNTPEQNAAFRAAFDATNARYRAAVKADQQQQSPKCPHNRGFNCRTCYPSQYANK